MRARSGGVRRRGPLDYVRLHVEVAHAADSGHQTGDTTIKPVASASLNFNQTFDLKTAGITTWAQLQNVYIRYWNNETGAATNPVRFNYIWLEVKFAVTRQLEWNYQIPNVTTEIIHNFTINAKVLAAGEAFNVSYSPDNETWFPPFTISSTVQKSYWTKLIDTPNSKYFIKIEDTDRTTTDTTADTLCVNMVSIQHNSPSASWSYDSTKWMRALGGVTAPNYITSIALGDVGSNAVDHKPDRKIDIVAVTTMIGSGDATHALWVVTTNSGGTQLDAAVNIPVVAAAAAIGTNQYDCKAVDLGDFNGDGLYRYRSGDRLQPRLLLRGRKHVDTVDLHEPARCPHGSSMNSQ